jgi:hypothetical protein
MRRVVVLVLCLCSGFGCTAIQGIREHIAYNDTTNDFVLEWRNSAWASQAWHRHKAAFIGHPYLRDFAEGFRAGYMDVANGANGCTPALPPRKYWNWRYQTAEGQAKVAAWFEGYPHGARAAEEDGAGLYSQIQVSESLRAEYRLGHEPPYPSPLYYHDPRRWCPPEQAEPDHSLPPAPESPNTPALPGQPSGKSPGQRDQAASASAHPTLGPTATASPQGTPSTQEATQLTGQNVSGGPGSYANATDDQPPADPFTWLPWARPTTSADTHKSPLSPHQ